MINRELRGMALIARVLLRFRSPKAFRRLGQLTALLPKLNPPKDLQVMERYLPRRDGKQLRVVIYKTRRPSGKPVPGILWAHGGGYLIGVPEQDVTTYRRLIEASECVIVAPDYRLGLEAPFPAALDDCYDALRWLLWNAAELGVRTDQIALAGMSAGGGLTAALALYARDQGKPRIAFQMPLYPMIDDQMTSISSTDNDAPVWNSVANQAAWQVYLGELYGKDVSPYAAPARAKNFGGLPPTCTFVGDLEPFRDETAEYVRRLREAGVPVAFEIVAGAYHGFDVMVPKAEISRKATAFYLEWFKSAVEQYRAPQDPR